MGETDPNDSWLHKPVDGAKPDANKNLFDALGSFGDSDLVADVTSIMHFATNMSAYGAELAQHSADGIFTPMSGGAGMLYGSGLKSSSDFIQVHNAAMTGFMTQVGDMTVSTMATGMAAQGAAVDYINADGKGALDVDSVYGTNLKEGQSALFTTGANGRPELSDAAKTPEQRKADAAEQAETDRQARELQEMLDAPGTVDTALEGSNHGHAPTVNAAQPISEQQPKLPGPGTWGGGDWHSMGKNGLERQQSGEGIIIERDDEGVELY